MKKIILGLTLLSTLTATAFAEEMDFRSNKYIVNCSISVNIAKADLSQGVDKKSDSDVMIYIADKADQPYTTDKEKVQRVYFRTNGGTALALYQICKEKLNSNDKRAGIMANTTDDEGEFMGTWITH